MVDSTEKKTCSGCGFLCAFHRQKQELVPLDDAMRSEWTAKMDRNSNLALVDDVPRCFVSAMPLGKEFEKSQNHLTWNKGLEVITKERDCPRFKAWAPGHSPKEHLDMENAEMMRLWMEQQKKDDRKAREDDKDADRKYQEEQKSEDRKFHVSQKRWDRAFAILLALTTFLVGWLLKERLDRPEKPPVDIEKKTPLPPP